VNEKDITQTVQTITIFILKYIDSVSKESSI